MKQKYPAEAFALGIVLFSAGMREAFAAGILVILTVVFAEFLQNLLEKCSLPDWSLRLCVYIAAGAVGASAFLLGFAGLGILLERGQWLMAFVVGLLCAHQALRGCVEADYGELLWESAIVWGFWILLAIAREFAGSGQIFGNLILQADFQSAAFQDTAFAFIAAGLALAFTNGVLKKSSKGGLSQFIVVPVMALAPPFAAHFLGELAGWFWAFAVSVVLFESVKLTLRFSRPGKAYRGLPVEMLAAGCIYMILSIY